MNEKIKEITDLIPHRPPFLWIDEILEVHEDHLIAQKTVRPEEPQFEGHYPGNPIMPGVILCEMVFQAAAVFMVKKFQREGDDYAKKVPLLTRIIDAKFKQIVRPGDVLKVQANYEKSMGPFHFMDGSIQCNGKTVMSVKYAMAAVDPDKAS